MVSDVIGADSGSGDSAARYRWRGGDDLTSITLLISSSIVVLIYSRSIKACALTAAATCRVRGGSDHSS